MVKTHIMDRVNSKMRREDLQLMIDISVNYYLEGKTQSQIAKEFYISRPKVSRMLKAARERNIVEIKVNYDSSDSNMLKRDIMNIFGVKNVFLVPTLSSEEETLKEVSKAAAYNVSKLIKDGMTIGVSWGKSIMTTTKFFRKKKFKDIHIVELFGTSNNNKDFDAISGASRDLANKLGAFLHPLAAPVYVKNKEARDIIKNIPLVNIALSKIDDADFILTSLGTVDSGSKSAIWEDYTDDNVKDEVLSKGGVGFILAHFYDINGQFLELEFHDYVVGITTDQIKGKKIVCVCAGLKKSKALFGALKGGLIDTLVCDEMTLRKALDYYKKNNSLESKE